MLCFGLLTLGGLAVLILLKAHRGPVYTTGFTRNAIIHNGVLDAGVNFLAKAFSSKTLPSRFAACWT